MSEGEILDAIRVALNQRTGVIVFRNNVGVANHWNQKTERVEVVRYGLAVGSSDLIGIVGGRFMALEVKTPKGRVTPEQALFQRLVRSMGGFACVVRSVEEAEAAVERALAGGVE